MAIQHVNAISNRLSLRPPHATAHAEANGGKPWCYLLIPHDQIRDQMTLAGLAAAHTVNVE